MNSCIFSMCKKICEVKPWSEALVNLWFVCNCTLFLFKPWQWQPQPWSPDVLKYLEVNLFPHIWDFSRDSHLCHVSCVMCVTLCPTGSSRHFWSTIFECFLDFYSESDSSSIPVTGQVRPGLCCSSWLYWAYGLWRIKLGLLGSLAMVGSSLVKVGFGIFALAGAGAMAMLE